MGGSPPPPAGACYWTTMRSARPSSTSPTASTVRGAPEDRLVLDSASGMWPLHAAYRYGLPLGTIMTTWARDAVFYHIYPLGLLGAPETNDHESEPVSRLPQLAPWTAHLLEMGVDAVYLGPVFESSRHGYDTSDYFTVDRRLGTNDDLRDLVRHFHAYEIRVILDAVYNHVGRDHFAFRDLLEHGEQSPYRDWFVGIDFSRRSPAGDPFTYHGWNGVQDLVTLDVANPAVREHLFAATRQWFAEFAIDGLRLDAADVLDRGFQRDLSTLVREIAPDAWLLGEAIHGDYREWAGPGMLDATTNYEAWKGLYSSFNDANLHEIGYALNRQFGPDGIYRDLPLYAFADNHDVTRIASLLHEPAHLYPLHVLLFTMPGVPSIYYGSEWGIPGVKGGDSDAALRPALRWPVDLITMPHPGLAAAISRLAAIRHESVALRHGDYHQVHVAAEQLAFARRAAGETIVVAINAATEPVPVTLSVDLPDGAELRDALDDAVSARAERGQIMVPAVPARWGRILRHQG